MRQQLTPAMLEELFASESDVVIFSCIKITHPELDHDLHFINSEENHVIAGQLHIGFGFEITLPGDNADTVPQITITIQNIDLEIVKIIRELTTPPKISFYVVTPDEPDSIQAGPFKMTLREASYNFQTVTLTCKWRDILNLNFPYHTFTPNRFPGLF